MREVIGLKLADSAEMPLPVLTRRDVRLPHVARKAHAVIGMRRAGKTYFLYQCLQDRLARGIPRDRLVYFNFEDERLAGLRAAELGLILEEYYRRNPQYRGRETVVFCFDEIQTVAGWEVFVRRVLDTEDAEVFVSGSSSKLLSREIATAMRGRSLETVITPFGFREYLKHHGVDAPEQGRIVSSRVRSRMQKAFDQYVTTGGFPEAQGLNSRDRTALLQGYVDVVLFRDVVERHEVSNVSALRALVRHVLQQPGASLSVTKLYNDFRSQGIAVSKDTLRSFVDHLEDAFLLRAVEVHARSERRRRVNPRKVYLADHTLAMAYQQPYRYDRGHHLENIVAAELFRRYRLVHYYKTTAGTEVDFLAQDPDAGEVLIQVAMDVSSQNTLEREIRPLREAEKRRTKAQLILLTETDLVTPAGALARGVRVMPIWEWLCGIGDAV